VRRIAGIVGLAKHLELIAGWTVQFQLQVRARHLFLGNGMLAAIRDSLPSLPEKQRGTGAGPFPGPYRSGRGCLPGLLLGLLRGLLRKGNSGESEKNYTVEHLLVSSS
jgi:hypothetical protein